MFTTPEPPANKPLLASTACRQHLLRHTVWPADAAPDELHAYVKKHLENPHSTAVIIDTGFHTQQGAHSAWVARQYSGTLGHPLLDRGFCLPRALSDDRTRLQEVGQDDHEVHSATG